MAIEPYLKKGTTITCPNGHEICDAKRDIASGEVVASEDFENWRYRKARPGDSTKCPMCGEDYIRTVIKPIFPLMGEPHTARGWLSEIV